MLPGIPTPSFYTIQDGLDPETSRSGRLVQQLSSDDFFKTIILIANNKEYTVREIILFEANIMGGVHAGAAKTDKEKGLEESGDLFVGGYDVPLRQLKAIARVILKALKPLKDEVRKSILI